MNSNYRIKAYICYIVIGFLLLALWSVSNTNSDLERQLGFLNSKIEDLTREQDYLSTDIAYENGYIDGESSGYDEGFADGYDFGFMDGAKAGYEDGYADCEAGY